MPKKTALLAAVAVVAAAIALAVAVTPGAQAAVVPAATPSDTQPPSTPTNLAAVVSCSLQVTLTWTASTDNVAVTGYEIFGAIAGQSSFHQVGSSTTTSFTEHLSNTLMYEVRARDAAGNTSGFSASVNALPPPCPTSPPPSTPPPADTQPPSTPGTPTFTVTCGVAHLTWAASTDNVGVTGYDIWRASGSSGGTFTAFGTSTTNSFTANGVGQWRFEVRARDAAGNTSAFTTPVLVSTPACPVTTGPTSPSSGGCSAVFSFVGNPWSTGFQGQVTVTNTGTTSTTGWTVVLTFPGTQHIDQIWSASTSSTASPYTITNAGYNAVLAPNASAIFGFLASGPASAPTVSCTRTP